MTNLSVLCVCVCVCVLLLLLSSGEKDQLEFFDEFVTRGGRVVCVGQGRVA
jgi:hypothetical protein